MITLAALSTQYIEIPVTELASGLPADPTTNPVHVAFMLGRAQPDTGDWKTGSWETSGVNGAYFARVLVGPNGGVITLTPGLYTVWLKIDASPETPIMQTGNVTVY